MKVLICRPRFDQPTEHTFSFAGEILDWCRTAGFDIIELAEQEAVRERVEEQLTKGIDIFIHYDHGREKALMGNDEKPVIDLKNCQLLANKETYTLACLSAKKLGVEVWRKEGKYWGYTQLVGFATDALPQFQESFNCGFKFRFLQGDSQQDALRHARDVFDRLALELVDAGKTFAAIWMRQNRDSLVYYNAHRPQGKGCLPRLLGFFGLN